MMQFCCHDKINRTNKGFTLVTMTVLQMFDTISCDKWQKFLPKTLHLILCANPILYAAPKYELNAREGRITLI